MMERLFRLSNRQTTVRTEGLAGVTTFLTMAYIIFVQPAVLSGKMFGTHTGREFGAVTTSTCVSAALATAIMALYARCPIAQAPGMCEKTSSLFSQHLPPRQQRASERVAGRARRGVRFRLFLILSLIGLRELIQRSRSRDQLVTYLPAIVLVVYFVFVRSRMG